MSHRGATDGFSIILAPAGRRRIGFAPLTGRTAPTAELLLDRWPLHTADGALDVGASTMAPLATLLVRSGLQGASTRLLVVGATASIGADASNDVVLTGLGVAPRHARLRLRGGVWTLADLGTPGGSWVDGEMVRGEALLAPGSSVRVGNIILAFDPEDRWQDSVPAEPGTERQPWALMPEASRPFWPTVFFVLAAGGIVVALYFLFRSP